MVVPIVLKCWVYPSPRGSRTLVAIRPRKKEHNPCAAKGPGVTGTPRKWTPRERKKRSQAKGVGGFTHESRG
eukprot:1646019-Pyramimonas_sp.AAC.1